MKKNYLIIKNKKIMKGNKNKKKSKIMMKIMIIKLDRSKKNLEKKYQF